MDEHAQQKSHPFTQLNSSASISDQSEGLSDMSLSTSPGSGDVVVPELNSLQHRTSAGNHDQKSNRETSTPPVHPRKRMVVRQLSSNPYLASAEMSPSDDHPIIVGSHSYASGDSRMYLTQDNSSPGVRDVDFYHHRSNSYPLTSDYLEETDEEEIEDDAFGKEEGKGCNDEHLYRQNKRVEESDRKNSNLKNEKDFDDLGHEYNDSGVLNFVLSEFQKGTTIAAPSHGDEPPSASSPLSCSQSRHLNHQSQTKQHNSKQPMSDSPNFISNDLYQQSNRRHNSEPHTFTDSSALSQQTQDSYSTSRKSRSSSYSQNPPEHQHGHNKTIQAFASKNQKNGYTQSNLMQPSPTAAYDTQPSSNTPNNRRLPQQQGIRAWGHFCRQHESHYKYRRSHYSSDSEDETAPSHRSSARMTQYARETRMQYQEHYKSQHTARGNSPPRTKDNTNITDKETRKKAIVKSDIKPKEFRDKFQTMKHWFSECNDGQKNLVLKGLLGLCELPQLHLLSVHMSKELHHGCPSNCEDILTWLPSDLAIKVMTYLDPVSLCHASQVCKVWHQLADDQSLWRRFCCQTKWRLSRAAEHKQVISHMCHEGSIQWKNVFAERYRLRNNWLKGRCTVRTFEGHMQGISCVQFDDSRIVSGSSDKTIKVWNMRTNAPWSVQTLMGHHGTVRCLHLEGNRLVSGSCDTTIKVWDLSTQESWSSIACKVTMTGHSDTVRCLQADDDKVISGSYDKTLKIWDLKSGELRRTLRGHEASVLCVHFSETKIVSGSADKTIKLWNYDGACMQTLCGHQDAVTCLMFDSTRIVSGSLDHNLKFWDIHSGSCLNTIDWKKAEGHTDVVRCLQADSWRVVSAADDRTIKVWNLETGERLVTLRNHTDGVTCLQFNDFIIVSGSYDKTVKLWDFSSC